MHLGLGLAWHLRKQNKTPFEWLTTQVAMQEATLSPMMQRLPSTRAMCRLRGAIPSRFLLHPRSMGAGHHPARFDALWATEIQKAADNGNSIWPVVQRKLDWRGKVSVTLMRANAQMLLSRATRQGALCPAHAHRARVTHLPAHTSPARAIHDRRNLAHSRSLCVARHGASARGV
jgi:hypothetical protein